MVKKRNILEIYNLNLLFWCIHFDLLTLIWKINVWNNSLLIYRRKNKLLFPCLYSDQPSLCHVSVRLEKTKCITCKRQKRNFHSWFNCVLQTLWPLIMMLNSPGLSLLLIGCWWGAWSTKSHQLAGFWNTYKENSLLIKKYLA